ncbi:reverse transcriptase domain-containing protein [Tanacetum coccineum]
MPFEEDKREAAGKTDTKLESTKLNNTWKLYTDGSTSSDGSGEGLMLINPKGKEYTYALRFEFKKTNNEVLVEVLEKRLIDDREVLQVEVKEGENWMTPIHEYLLSGLLPEDPKESRKIRIKASQYKLVKGSLYKKSFFTPWLRCIAPPQVDNIIKEIHEDNSRLYTMQEAIYGKENSRKGCNSSWQRMDIQPLGSQHSRTFTNGPRRFKVSGHSSGAFYKMGRSKASDHFKREADRKVRMGIHSMQIWGSTNNQREGKKAFHRRHIHISLQRIKDHTILFLHHKHTKIMNHIEKQLTRSQQGWVDDLARVLWVYRTLLRNSQNETPFSLTYGSEAIIRIAESIVAKDNKDTTKENAKRKESKEVASIKEAYYQNKLRRYHDVRSNRSTYKLGDFVLLSLSDTESSQTCTWMAFGENTRNLGSFGEETDEITDLHQILEEILLTWSGDGVTSIKRHRRDPSSDGIRDFVTASRRGRLNEDLESST